MTYLSKDRHGNYHFRRVIPKALRPFMPENRKGKTVWKKALGTSKPEEAKRAIVAVLSQCTADFDFAERTAKGKSPASVAPLALNPLPAFEMTPEEMERAGAHFRRKLLEGDDIARRDGDDRWRLQTPEARHRMGPDLLPIRFGERVRGMEPDFKIAYRAEVREFLGEYREALASGNIGPVEAEVRSYLAERGVRFEAGSDDHFAFAEAVLRAHVAAYEAISSRLEGAVVETPAAPSPPQAKGPKLSEAFDAWKAGGFARDAKRPSEGSAREAGYAVRRFTELHGDLRLGDITKAQAREFQKAVSQCPARLPATLKALPLPKVIVHPIAASLPKPKTATLNKLVNLLSAIVRATEKAGHFDDYAQFRNPFSGLREAVGDNEDDDREPFNGNDLGRLFSSGVFTQGDRPSGGAGEAAFWLPIIGLFSGARINEIAQLRMQDLTQDPETGIWLLDISTSGGRTLKTKGSRRKLPLHPHLIEIGLLRYRTWLEQHGFGPDDSLWPGLRASSFVKWFTRFRRKAGVDDPNKVFHSFRHTFKDMGRDSGLSEELNNALTGHVTPGVAARYGRGAGLKAKLKGIKKVAVPKAVRDLSWSPPKGPPVKQRVPKVITKARREELSRRKAAAKGRPNA